MRRGMDCLVRGMKGDSEGSVSGSEGIVVGRVVVDSEGCVVTNADCGAGAVQGRIEGLGSGGSREVVRRGKAG